MIVAIGPVATVPSWNWVGLDAVKELSKYFQVEIFNSFNTLPGASVIIVVKKMPPLDFVKTATDKGKKIIYLPIDYFESPEEIKIHSPSLRMISVILSHAESLMDYFKAYAPVYLIEHANKYMLPKMAEYKPGSFVLWVGGYQFVPYILHWLSYHPIPGKLIFCTDYNNKSAITRAGMLADRMKTPLKHSYEMQEWSESTQKQLMQEAKAAMDIKGGEFSQIHKPPTKAQKYIASGIPFAINRGNNCFDYFFNRGLTLCEPNDTINWFSEHYFQHIRDFGKKVRILTSSEEVGRLLKKCVEVFSTPGAKIENTIGLTIHRN